MKKTSMLMIAGIVVLALAGVISESKSNQEKKDSEDCVVIDTTPDLDEKWMWERSYPKCPADVDCRLYELMLADLDGRDMYSDVEKYWRKLQIIDMAKDEGETDTDAQNQAHKIKKNIESHAATYNAASIKDPEMRKVAISNVKAIATLTSADNTNEIMHEVFDNLKATSALRSLLVSNDAIGAYWEGFYDALKKDMTDNWLKAIRFKYESGNVDGYRRRISELERIMASGKYHRYLPFIWKSWRYHHWFAYGSPSKDGTMPNWYYNEQKLKCFATILRQIKAHPDDTTARSAALVLLDMSNVQIFGEYTFGNQIPLEEIEWKE